MIKGWEKLTSDKIFHILAGFVIGFAVFNFYGSAYALISVIVAGVGKELYDEYIGGSGFEFFDLFATLIGGVAGIMVYGMVM